MGRGSADSRNASKTAGQMQGQLGNRASSLYGTVAPSLTAEALNPAGFNPKEMAEMDAAAMGAAAGTKGAAEEEAKLDAARTGNIGGFGAALAESARSAGRGLMESALGTRIKNAMLKQDQRRAAIGQLGDMYGQNVQGANQAGQVVADNVRATAEDKRSGFGRMIVSTLLSGLTGGRAS